MTGTSRITAIETWIRGQVGDDLGSALRGMIVTEKIVRGFEELAARHTTQGYAPFSHAHRAVSEGAGRVSDEDYAKMTPARKMAYAKQFPQPKAS